MNIVLSSVTFCAVVSVNGYAWTLALSAALLAVILACWRAIRAKNEELERMRQKSDRRRWQL